MLGQSSPAADGALLHYTSICFTQRTHPYLVLQENVREKSSRLQRGLWYWTLPSTPSLSSMDDTILAVSIRNEGGEVYSKPSRPLKEGDLMDRWDGSDILNKFLQGGEQI
jgi:hypothetical protein